MNAKAQASAAARERRERPMPAPHAAPTERVARSALSSGAPSPFPQSSPSPLPSVTTYPQGGLQPDLSAIRSNAIQVAVLVPLSGKQASLGQAMLNAAQMAVFDLAPQNFELMPRDTAGTPEQAVQAARDAIASGARLLIGPLFARDVAAVKPIVQTSTVNMLALTTDVSLAEPGVYVMGFAPSQQVNRIIAFAAGQSLHRFAGVFPPSAYGALVKKAFEEAVLRAGGEIVAETQPAKAASLLPQKDKIDALFLPLTGSALEQTIAQIGAAGGIDTTKTRILGTGLWDGSTLGKTPFLTGAWYAAPDPAAREAFTEKYKKTFNAPPPRLVSLAYDATALAAVLAAQGQPYDRLSLANPNGFAGLDGIFRFAPTGQAERALAINELTAEGSSHVLSPAATTFQ